MPTPNLIIHGGAGAITRENLSPEAWRRYSSALLHIHRSTSSLLNQGTNALDAATHAVTLFEDCELFNCGKGAVFTRDGTVELEASIMTTHPYHKRATAAVLLKHVKNPIKFAREMLIRGDRDLVGPPNEGGDGDPAGPSGGAQGHCCLGGKTAESLAEAWGLEMVDEHYFWTRKRWEQHRRGLGKEDDGKTMICEDSPEGPRTRVDRLWDRGEEGWDGLEYLPQGTVGCVALDADGGMCVATSTGGLTNKLAGRIGDTPTIGAGFWAEEWVHMPPEPPLVATARKTLPPLVNSLFLGLQSIFGTDCLPSSSTTSNRYSQIPHIDNEKRPTEPMRAVAISGTGNGDSFLRLCACRTAGAIVRFSSPPPGGLPIRTLASALNQITGPAGELEKSAGDRWGKTGEGEGGMIGIEYVNGKSEVVFDFNCGGLFRCWIDATGQERVMVFRDEY